MVASIVDSIVDSRVTRPAMTFPYLLNFSLSGATDAQSLLERVLQLCKH